MSVHPASVRLSLSSFRLDFRFSCSKATAALVIYKVEYAFVASKNKLLLENNLFKMKNSGKLISIYLCVSYNKIRLYPYSTFADFYQTSKHTSFIFSPSQLQKRGVKTTTKDYGFFCNSHRCMKFLRVFKILYTRNLNSALVLLR